MMALALLGISRASKEEIIRFLKINADFDATNDEEIRNVFHLLRQISAKTKEAAGCGREYGSHSPLA